MSDWQTMTRREIDREITKGDDDTRDEAEDEAEDDTDEMPPSLDQLLQHRRLERAQDQQRQERERADQLAEARASERHRVERYLGPTLLHLLAPSFEPPFPDSPRVHAHFVVDGDTLALGRHEHSYDYYSPSSWNVIGPHDFTFELYAGEQDYETASRHDQILDAIDLYLEQRPARQAHELLPTPPPAPPQRHCIAIWGDGHDSGVLSNAQRVRVIVDSGLEEGYSQTTSYEGALEDRDEHWLLLTQDSGAQLLLPVHVLRAIIPLPPREG